ARRSSGPSVPASARASAMPEWLAPTMAISTSIDWTSVMMRFSIAQGPSAGGQRLTGCLQAVYRLARTCRTETQAMPPRKRTAPGQTEGKAVASLLDILDLEPIEKNLYRGR